MDEGGADVTEASVCSGVAQGMITGIRGLCNGLGPALYGFIFFLFNVELNEAEPMAGRSTASTQVRRNAPC